MNVQLRINVLKLFKAVDLLENLCERNLTVLKIYLIIPPDVANIISKIQDDTLISNLLTTVNKGYTLVKIPVYLHSNRLLVLFFQMISLEIKFTNGEIRNFVAFINFQKYWKFCGPSCYALNVRFLIELSFISYTERKISGLFFWFIIMKWKWYFQVFSEICKSNKKWNVKTFKEAC